MSLARIALAATAVLLAVVGCGSETDAAPANEQTTASSGETSSAGALLYAADVAGVRAIGSDESLLQPPEGAVMLTLSPRGGSVAYLLPDSFGEGSGIIALGALGGGEPSEVLRVNDFGEFGWASDGSHLFVAHTELNEFGNPSPVLSIVDSTTRALISQVKPPEYDSLVFHSMTEQGSVAVSPDGSQVAVSAIHGDEPLAGFIAVIQLTNPFSYTEIAPQSETDKWFPFSWTREGIFALHRSCPQGVVECSHAIELLDPSSGAALRTLQADLPSGTSPGEPALSPDGATLGWVTFDGLYLGPAEGELQQLTDGDVNTNTLSLGTAP